MDAFALLSRTEGIIPAIESAHAVAGAVDLAREIGPGGDRAGQRLRTGRQGHGDRDARGSGSATSPADAPRALHAHDPSPTSDVDAARPARPAPRGTDDRLSDAVRRHRAEGRAALVGYLPAGFPTVDASAELLTAMIDGGCDLVEVGLPFSDPVLDGPVIQAAAETRSPHGFRLRDMFAIVERVTAAGGSGPW